MKRTFCDSCDDECQQGTGIYIITAFFTKLDGCGLTPDENKKYEGVDLCGACAHQVRQILEGKRPRVVKVNPYDSR